ncbi:50S ribosomal protein L3 [Candidatus Daviesbacteria bacterium RIFCSPLOWO2_02_FULL_40_8]|uniref:Large ribosomal subunit protein uL3 n=1 Tax=Candidatus Daviesbacteria bacterium RIFCSPLOWO2_01_FULL_40_24 TaxID=1797787 RepID=A0A1F5MJT5_9BACT|nr:MAG: 50S ribosomal protein L3 [Candidatus Daviesbacteria bacterium RIFCSPHIGHO2_01_FULL_41_45]OGE35379.1 MAG: 50S ribosomal protein L3 [Candidatus Daviesbacteria bacterium RIFCSPHIGHO2_02_FULL_41_14]OGE65622.1 MAG: 50S ribosomal protein L3 [Candidatus Daviesbacteria bacterium RIFCSPLOWO2_01_FULL_40_24]OGE66301.1 MAG: 50S ribosomal protein L3 [Candidatus Daviesbacteria bacterium RIFCSPLOWO2_02_FULL_40_8]
MLDTLFGIKKNMTSSYDSRGRRVGATVIEVTPHFITQVKTADKKDGYSAVQLGFGNKKNLKKPQMGHIKKAGVTQPLRWLRELRIKTPEASEEIKPGTQILVNQVFSIGDAVKVTGISKGKGFQGGVRRHGFAGGPKTHGQSDRHRAPGSIGQTTTPGRVYKGKKMAGHMGVDTVSTRNLEVLAVDKVSNLLVLKGAVPGSSGSVVSLTKLGRIKGYTPPPEEKVDENEEAVEEAVGNPAEVITEQEAVVKEGEENAS